MKKLLFTFLILFCFSNKFIAATDTLHLYDDINKATLIIAIKDYKASFQNKLGRKAMPFLKYIDSVTSSKASTYITLDKKYWMSFSFYQKEDFVLMDNALMEAFNTRKVRILKDGQSYNIDNTKVVTKKTRLCNKRFSAVTGLTWVIKASKGKKVITELVQSKNENAYKMVNCI